ncbi:MAG: nickel pincer cofactor biosynthesis protein LarC [Limisphaerales bacterium]
MQTLYLDIFSGLSGDMLLGALIDLGVNPAGLEAELRSLPVEGWHLHVDRASKSGIEGVKVDVHLAHEHGHDHHHHEEALGHGHGAAGILPAHHAHAHHHEDEHENHAHSRDFAEIRRLIEGSALSPWVKEKAVAVFRRIAVAEGKIHGHPPDEVHFHEVGAVDSIVDIVGACIGLELLGRPRVLAGPVIEGTGFIRCAHGRLPLPAPATLEVFAARGVAVTQCDEPHELVTPTGAALLAEFAESFAPIAGLVPRRVGYGLGTRDNHTRPNVVRAVLGETAATGSHPPALDWETDTVVVLETNLDDTTAEVLGHFTERALAAGALDVFHTPVTMKKHRPGTLLTVLCAAGDADRFTELMLRETTAFGVRRLTAERRKLRREFREVATSFGPVQVKLGLLNGRAVQASPEYESCRAAAEAAGVPLREVYTSAVKAVG